MQMSFRISQVSLLMMWGAPALSCDFLSWGQRLRMFGILIGLVYLYYRKNGFGEESFQKSFLVVSSLLYMYMITQFDPYVCLKSDTVFNGYFLTLSLLFSMTLIAWGGHAFSLKREQRSHIFARPDIKGFDTLALIGVLALAILNFIVYIVDIPSFGASGRPRLSIYIKLSQCLFLYFFLSRFLPLTGDSFRRYLMRFAIGALSVVALLSAWQLNQLFKVPTLADTFLTNRKWDQAADTYLSLVEKNKASFELFRFTLDEVMGCLRASPTDIAGKNYVMGRIAFANGRIEEANAYLKEAINANSKSSNIPIERCFTIRNQILMEVANWGELLNNSLGGLQTSPKNLNFMLQAGIAYTKIYDYEHSFSLLQSTLNMVPEKSGKNFLDSFPQNRLVSINEFLPERLRKYENQLFLYELTRLLGVGGHEVFYPDEEIGSTGVRTPVTIFVRSAGYGVGTAWILINGHDIISDFGVGRGYNMAILNPETRKVWKMGRFDASDVSPVQGRAMLDFVDSAPDGWIVIATVSDNASNLTRDGVHALLKIGSIKNVIGRWRWGHIVIGVKGAAPGMAVELVGQAQIDAYVLAGNFKPSTKDALEEIQNRVKKTSRGALYITGLKLNDKVAWISSSN